MSSKIAITGGYGFLGWHTAVRFRAEHKTEPVLLGRDDFSDPQRLRDRLREVQTVVHLAGINRAETDEQVEAGNVAIATEVANAVKEMDQPVHVVNANSIQAHLDNPYGRGKAKAAELLKESIRELGGTFADIRLPNIFGEHGRPAYNSFVATFCHAVANGQEPVVHVDKQVSLLHAQDAAEVLIGAANNRSNFTLMPEGEPHSVTEILRMLRDFHEKYSEGQIPALPTKFSVDLFNTYRSYMFPTHYPFKSTVHGDQRGELFETVRFHGGTGQTFVSTTVPGASRGDHYHLSKIERFFVVSGEAEIALRRALHEEIITLKVSGKDRAFIDMPTMWVHNITNVGDSDLITMFWADQLLNPAAPDTYWEPVTPSAEESVQ